MEVNRRALRNAVCAAAVVCATPAVWLAFETVARSHPEGAAPASAPRLGSPAPDFSLSDPSGDQYTLSDSRGKKVLLVFLCGCARCRSLTRGLQREFGGCRGVQILGLAHFSPADASDFQSKTGIHFPLLVDPFGRVADRFQSVACPRCWLIDEDGTIVYSSRGPTDKPEYVEDSIRKLIRS